MPASLSQRNKRSPLPALNGLPASFSVIVPAFAALLRGDATPARAESLTKDSLQTVFVRVTQSCAGQRPTIVLIEDL